MRNSILYALAFAARALCNDATFLSRTDLQPSQLNVTKNDDSDKLSDDYIFLAPWVPGEIPSAQTHIGPHIFSSDGELVWSGYGYLANSISNFMPTKYNGEDAMSFYEGNVGDTGVGFGSFRLMDQSFDIKAKVGLKQPFLHDFHEFQMTGSHTAAFSTYHAVPYNFSDVDGATDDNKWVFENMVTEIDVNTDEVLFQWNSLDHIHVNDSKVKDSLESDGKDSNRPFDYMHLNSIEKDESGNFLISCRHLWSVYYIDGKSGEVIWTLGMSEGGSDWELEDVAEFGYQHHARWVDPEVIGKDKEEDVRYMSIFDNGKSGAANATPLRENPRGIILKLDSSDGATSDKEKIGKVTLVQDFYPPEESDRSPSQGSMQVLSNGNVFMGWGSTPKVSEHTIDGTLIFAATINDGDHESYRAFKGPFSGKPKDEPALVSVYNEDDGKTKVYFSWNGATEVKSWNLYGGDSKNDMKEIKSGISNDKFETTYEADGYYAYTKVEAVSTNGSTINEGHSQTYFQK
jgi:hypothetical protein